jgi:hypothetical protein
MDTASGVTEAEEEYPSPPVSEYGEEDPDMAFYLDLDGLLPRDDEEEDSYDPDAADMDSLS